MKTLSDFTKDKVNVSLQEYTEKFGANVDHYAEDTKELTVYKTGNYINNMKDGSFIVHANMQQEPFKTLEAAEEHLWYKVVIYDQMDHIPESNCCSAPIIDETDVCSKEDTEILDSLKAYLNDRNWNTASPIVEGVMKHCAQFIKEWRTNEVGK
jgi:hypothetical protein